MSPSIRGIVNLLVLQLAGRPAPVRRCRGPVRAGKVPAQHGEGVSSHPPRRGRVDVVRESAGRRGVLGSTVLICPSCPPEMAAVAAEGTRTAGSHSPPAGQRPALSRVDGHLGTGTAGESDWLAL